MSALDCLEAFMFGVAMGSVLFVGAVSVAYAAGWWGFR